MAVGIVTEVHSTVLAANDHSVSVRIRDTRVVVPRIPVAVGVLGFVAMPAVDDVVVVAFADGDPHAGVVVGRLYDRDLAPPEHGAGQLVLQLPAGASSPNIDVLADPATPELTLKVGDTTVEITGKSATITIGDAELVVDGNSPAAVTVRAGDASIELGANGNLKLEASNKLEIKASQITIEGSGKVTVSGGTVEVN
ncbi:phage baseplate assembly protein V [Humibacillus xanthopallidus]|uniref:phage baseplate assembly protein V n=1 Tax=Humibacillus xanthopallidus TaxID=412689 RepID=UPI0031D19F9E